MWHRGAGQADLHPTASTSKQPSSAIGIGMAAVLSQAACCSRACSCGRAYCSHEAGQHEGGHTFLCPCSISLLLPGGALLLGVFLQASASTKHQHTAPSREQADQAADRGDAPDSSETWGPSATASTSHASGMMARPRRQACMGQQAWWAYPPGGALLPQVRLLDAVLVVFVTLVMVRVVLGLGHRGNCAVLGRENDQRLRRRNRQRVDQQWGPACTTYLGCGIGTAGERKMVRIACRRVPTVTKLLQHTGGRARLCRAL